MNAAMETSRAPTAHPTHKFQLLLRREFWEHRGGFFWAPLITGAIAIFFIVLAAIAGTVLGHKHGMHVEGDGDPSKFLGAVGDIALLGGIGLAMAVLAFVVFFYSLGSLYDDRRDRSILFWKSLPISDEQMVLSKATWALIAAPLLALVIGVAIGLALWVITMLTTTVNGISGTSAVLTHSHPFRIVGEILLTLPVQILWSLPAVGWLMFCSAWSRRVPFLWAVMLPILGCTVISFMGGILHLTADIQVPHAKIWYTIVYRGILSVVPGSWIPTISDRIPQISSPENLPDALSLGASWQVFASADVWIGAAIGIVFIYSAIRLRRWRDDN